jgi:hypothetical protein
MALSTTEISPTPAQRERITTLLGREPRGLRAIAVADTDGEPIVIRVASGCGEKTLSYTVLADR